jgi:hypothetical protein
MSNNFAAEPSGNSGEGQGYVPVSAAAAKNGLGTAALVIGVIAFVFSFIPFINAGSGFIAFVGLVLGVIGIFQKGKSKNVAIVGSAISFVALILSIVLSIAYTAAFFSSVDSAVSTDSQVVETDPASGETDGAADDAAEPLGTRTNPAPIGTLITIGNASAPDYEVTLGAPTLNGNEAIAAVNPYNDQAPEGFEFAIVPVTVTYIGAESGTPWLDLSVKFVSAAGTTHTTSDAFVVEPDPTFMSINELYPGASATGNIVILIPIADAEAGSWVVSATFFGEDFFFKAI